MISFLNDYDRGCHPRILEALSQSNDISAPGYGLDPWCSEARALLRREVACPNAPIHFVAGGTLTNALALAAILRPHEAVLAPESGHIVRHEAGAIEATGHKVITVRAAQGKVTPQAVREVLEANSMAPHMAKARVLYISQSTELGTLYDEAELEALAALCRKEGLLFYLDGARLGAAVVAGAPSLARVAELTDLFWIGGTKGGAMFGEALVFSRSELAQDFEYLVKQRGAMLAKGRFLGVNFVELFRDGLYFELAKRAHQMAQALVEGILAKGLSLSVPWQSNQVFVRVSNEQANVLEKNFAFHRWAQSSSQQVELRFVCSWATRAEEVEALLAAF